MHTGQLTSSSILYFSLPPILSLHLAIFGQMDCWSLKPNSHSNNHGTVPIYRREALPGLGSYLPTEQHSDPSQLQGLQQRERQWQRAYQRRPTASVSEEKRQRHNHAHLCPPFTRAQKQFPPKLNNRRCQPIRSKHSGCVRWLMHRNAAI